MIEPALPFDAIAVARREQPSLAELDACAHEGPLILTGCMQDWPLLSALRNAPDPADKLGHIEKLVGHRKVRYTLLAPENRGHLGYGDGLKSNFTTDSGGRVRFRQFAERLLRIVKGGAPEIIYMQAQSIRQGLRELGQTLRVPSVLDGASVVPSKLWMGSGNHIVNLHFDPYQNFIGMLEGRKRITLLPPSSLPDIYPGPFDRSPAGAPSSLVRLLDLDFDRYPKLQNALKQARVAVLEPGEILYVPSFWWHHVESFGLNIMVNTWKLEVDLELMLACMALVNDSMPAFFTLAPRMRQLGRNILRGYVFPAEGSSVITGEPITQMPDKKRFSRALQLLGETILTFEKLPEHWRKVFSMLYDYFVFQTYGDPFPTLPGEYDAWMERKRKSALRRLIVRSRWLRALLIGTPVRLRAGEPLA